MRDDDPFSVRDGRPALRDLGDDLRAQAGLIWSYGAYGTYRTYSTYSTR